MAHVDGVGGQWCGGMAYADGDSGWAVGIEMAGRTDVFFVIGIVLHVQVRRVVRAFSPSDMMQI